MHAVIFLAPARVNTLIKLAAGLLLTLSAIQVHAADAGQERRKLVPDDFYRALDVSDPQVSPDGLWVAYVVTTNEREADEARSAVWMVSWDGRQRLALTRIRGRSRSRRRPRRSYRR